MRVGSRVKSVVVKKDTLKSVIPKPNFDTLLVESKDVKTAILLLKSEEVMVVTQALGALDKYAAKCDANLFTLMRFEVIKYLMPLIKRSELPIKRFASKVLAKMCPILPYEDLMIEETVPLYAQVLAKEVDVPMQEFSSAVLAELTKEDEGLVVYLQSDTADILFTRLKSIDPDVQNNCGKIIENVLLDEKSANEFVKINAFSFDPILALLQSDYPVIQNQAIKILNILTQRREEKPIQEKFRQSKGIEELTNILENFDWKDLHSAVLAVLSNICDCPIYALYMNSTGIIKKLLEYAENIHDSQLIEETWSVLGKMATTEAGRKALCDNGVVEYLLAFLEDDRPEIQRVVCIAIARMTKDVSAVEILLKMNPMKYMVDIMRSEFRPWETRVAAVKAINTMLEADKRFFEPFLALRAHGIVFQILRPYLNKAPADMLASLLDCLIVLAIHEDVRYQVVENDVTQAILPHLEAHDIDLRILACQCLKAYMCEETVRENFMAGNGVSSVSYSLMSQNLELQKAAASLLQVLASDEGIASAFVKNNTLDWMIDQKVICRTCPAWEEAIYAIFRNCLPAKFAYLGRLDMEDITRPIFYLMRHTVKFQILEDLLMSYGMPSELTYVANFNDIPSEESDIKVDGSQSTSSYESNGRRSTSTFRDYDEHYDHPLPDPDLLRYLVDVQVMTCVDLATKEDEFTITTRAQSLGRYVAQQMSGPTREPDKCTNHAYALHITELMQELSSNVIPIGLIKTGLHFERAMLFKVLADRLGVPCAMVRGEYGGRTWIEVAAPQLDPEGEKHPLPYDELPTRLIRPNCVVDLMENPGMLYPLDSYEAAKYCALPSAEI